MYLFFSQVVQLDHRPHGMSWDLICQGIEIDVKEVDGTPKFDASGRPLNPLDNSCYDIEYRGREYANCSSTISLENFLNKQYPCIFKAL